MAKSLFFQFPTFVSILRRKTAQLTIRYDFMGWSSSRMQFTEKSAKLGYHLKLHSFCYFSALRSCPHFRPSEEYSSQETYRKQKKGSVLKLQNQILFQVASWKCNIVKPMAWTGLTEEYTCGVFQAGWNFEKKDASNWQRDLIQWPHKAAGCSLVITDYGCIMINTVLSKIITMVQ